MGMKGLAAKVWEGKNVWIAVGLVLANGLAWLNSGDIYGLVEVEPWLAPELTSIRETLWAGESAGESFRIVITDQIASEAVAWFLDAHPEVPFSHASVAIDPNGITGSGLAHVFGLRTLVHGRVGLELHGGVPVVSVQELSIASLTAPQFVLETIGQELAKQFDLSDGRLPMEITLLELDEGRMTVEGVYR